MKKALSLFFIAMLLLSLTVSAIAMGEEHPYVTDGAGVLSRDTIEKVNEINDRLYERYGTYVVVVFLDYFGSTDPAEYTVGLFNAWGIDDNAALLVAAVREKNGGISLGSAIDNRSNEDDMTELLEDHFWPDFDDGNYDHAVTKLMGAMEDWFEDELGGGSSGSGGSGSSSGWLAGLGILGVFLGFVFRNIIIILVFVVVIAAVIWSDRRRYRGYYRSIGGPIPRYYPWYIFTPSRPYHRYRPPRPARPAPPPRSARPSRPPSRPGSFRSSGGHSSSFSGRSSRPSSSRPPSSRPSGGSFRSGGGRSGGGFSGRR